MTLPPQKKKNIHKIFIPPKYYFFLKTPQNIEIQTFDPQKWPEPTYVWKYQSAPWDWSAPLLFTYWNVSYLNLLQRNFNFLASLWSWGEWLESRFVGDPKDSFVVSRPMLYTEGL